MTRYWTGFIILAAVLLQSGFAAAAAPEKTLPDGSHQITFSVPDMECSMCSRGVGFEIKKLTGIGEIKFDDLNRLVFVRFDPKRIDVKRIQQAIKRAGFSSQVIEPPPAGHH